MIPSIQAPGWASSAPVAPHPSSATPGADFKEFLLDSLDQVNHMQLHADRAVEQLLTGGDVNPAEVLTAVQKADLSFKLMLQIRNKLVQAFQEVRSIQI